MANCVQCGITIPEGQRTCSMCYGDPDHGKDGYYRDWQEREMRRQWERDQWEEIDREIREDNDE